MRSAGKGKGLEAYRGYASGMILQGYGGRCRASLRPVHSPAIVQRLKSGALQVRQHEDRCKADGCRRTLDEDPREHHGVHLPVELETHLQLNQASFADCQVQNELSTYVETWVGLKLKAAT